MDKILNQFRRIYSDNGSGDKDFSVQESRLRNANERLTKATEELVRASQRLNDTAMEVGGLDMKTLN